MARKDRSGRFVAGPCAAGFASPSATGRDDQLEPEVGTAHVVGRAQALDAYALAVVDQRRALVDRPALRRQPGPDGVREAGQGPPLGGVDVDGEGDEPQARVDGQLLEVLTGLLGADLQVAEAP